MKLNKKISGLFVLMLCVVILSAGTSWGLSIGSSFSSGGNIGSTYSSYVYASGTSPYTWTLTGTVPKGLTYYVDGYSDNYANLKGVLEEAGTYKFTLKLKDSTGASVSRTYTIKVTRPTLSISRTYPSKIIGYNYSEYVTISGGSYPYTWTLDSGSLPPGLSLSYYSNYAYLSGTPSKTGTYNFTLKASDRYGTTLKKAFTVKISQPSLSIGGNLKNGTVGSNYGYVLDPGVNGTDPYTWSVTSGTLPPGLKLTSTNSYYAHLMGIPTKAGTYKFKVKVADRYGANTTKSFTVKITNPSISVSASFSNGTVGSGYSKSLSISGGNAPYNLTVAKGSLPPGLKAVSTGTTSSSPYISGVPTKAGTYKFTLKITDRYGVSTTKAFSIKIVNPSLSIQYSFYNGTVGSSYSDYVYLSGGLTGPVTWKLDKGSLPPGLRLVGSSGSYTSYSYAYLRGTPTKAGTYKFTLKATDYYGVSVSKAFTLTISAYSMSIYSSFRSGTVGSSYEDYVYVSGGSGDFKWTKSSGTLPDGLKLISYNSYVYLVGRPKSTGTYRFTLKATDYYGASISESFSITITSSNYALPSQRNEVPKSSAPSVNEDASITSENDTAADSVMPENYNNSDSLNEAQKSSTDDLNEDASRTSENGTAADSVTPETYNNSDSEDGLALFTTSLKANEADVLEAGTDRDEGLVTVRADQPLTFIVGEWVNSNGTAAEVYDVKVFIDGEGAEGIEVSEEGTFVLPAEIVHDDFKVVVKAKSGNQELETEELYISAEK